MTKMEGEKGDKGDESWRLIEGEADKADKRQRRVEDEISLCTNIIKKLKVRDLRTKREWGGRR